jgi:hypothetical protein
MITVEPMGFHIAGTFGWPVRWLMINTETEEITMFTQRECIDFCGFLTGDNPRMTLVFERDGLIRSYFKVFDPDTKMCIGNARCLKATSRRILNMLTKPTY